MEQAKLSSVHVVHFSQLMLFSGLFASLVFHPAAEWKQPTVARTGRARKQSVAS